MNKKLATNTFKKTFNRLPEKMTSRKAVIERIQRQAFLEGYQYAIQVLEESLVKTK